MGFNSGFKGLIFNKMQETMLRNSQEVS